MPAIDLSILNQRQTPAFYADTLANRPAAGFVGRIFVSTNTFAFFRDNGTGWDLIGGPGTGTVTGSGTAGQVTFWDGASTITGDSGLTYNGSTNALTSLGTIKATNYYVGNPTDLTRAFSASGNANTIALWLEEYGDTPSAADIFLNKGRGTESLKANVQIGDSLGGAAFSGYVNGSLNPSLAWGSEVVNINTTNNFADADFSIGQTYNGTAFNTNLRIRAIDGFVVAPNGGFETTGNINLFAGANTRRIVFDANNGIARIFSFRTGNLPRWAFRVDGTETGSSTGADLAIRRYDDTGAFVDAPLSINRASGQSTFVKKVIINNNTGDDQLQIVSTTAPSLRIDNAVTGATKRAGLGIATAVNNFIQGSVDRDYCIFNSSTTASPILFGVYDAGAGNTQEAARISPARNFLVGTITDSGQKLIVSGTTLLSGNTIIRSSTTNQLTLDGGTTVQSRIVIARGSDDNAQGMTIGYSNITSYRTSTPLASPQTDFSLNQQGSDGTRTQLYMSSAGNIGINTTIPRGVFDVRVASDRGVAITGIVSNETIISGIQGDVSNNLRNLRISSSNLLFNIGDGTNSTGSQAMFLSQSGNLVINSGVDNGNKLQVDGNSNFTGTMFVATPGSSTGVTFRTLGATNNPGLFISTIEATGRVTAIVSGSTGALDLGLGAGGGETLTLKGEGQVRFVPRASNPAAQQAGDVYYNSTTNKLRLYDGTNWVDLN